MHDFATHEKEIDDIDFSPDSARLLSISKDKVSLVFASMKTNLIVSIVQLFHHFCHLSESNCVGCEEG